jgi:hypothetical protein
LLLSKRRSRQLKSSSLISTNSMSTAEKTSSTRSQHIDGI